LLDPDGENAHLEYKASLRTLADGTVAKVRETRALRTIAAVAPPTDPKAMYDARERPRPAV
jgi:hypothetical protein